MQAQERMKSWINEEMSNRSVISSAPTDAAFTKHNTTDEVFTKQTPTIVKTAPPPPPPADPESAHRPGVTDSPPPPSPLRLC